MRHINSILQVYLTHLVFNTLKLCVVVVGNNCAKCETSKRQGWERVGTSALQEKTE